MLAPESACAHAHVSRPRNSRVKILAVACSVATAVVAKGLCASVPLCAMCVDPLSALRPTAQSVMLHSRSKPAPESVLGQLPFSWTALLMLPFLARPILATF